ncbi:MAG: radical SAM protein [Pseudomonadota bacterium]
MPSSLPPDAALLPLPEGALLVSPSLATFCPIPAASLPALERALAGAPLPPALQPALTEHGFFGLPRPPEPDPPTVQIQLTNACDLGCAYCCTNSGGARAEELRLADLLPLLPRLKPLLGDDARVAVLGGEPLLVPWAPDLCEAVRAQGLPLTLFSNGLALGQDDALAQRVAALVQGGMSLRVSLAGATRESCDALSGAPRFEGVLAGLAALHRHGGRATVDLMLVPEQVEEVAEQLPALRRRLPPGTPIALGLAFLGGRERGEHVFPSRADMEAALDRIALEAGEAIAAPKRAPVTFRREGCGCALGHHLHLRSDGALFSCFKMEEPVGHLRGEGFATAVACVRGQPHPAATLPACRDCPLRTLCGGGCRSENLLLTGDADVPACGPWRPAVIAALLAERCVTALHWPAPHLLAEAHRRGIPAPERLALARPSLHCHPS